MKINRYNKIAIKILNDVFISLFSTWAALSLRLDKIYLPSSFAWHENIFLIFIIAIICFLIIFYIFKIYYSVIRFSGLKTLINITLVGIVYATIFSATLFILKINGIPRSIGIIQPIIFILLVILSRIVAVQLIESYSQSKNIKKVIIYGAGLTGIETSKALAGNNNYQIEAFIDKDSKKIGTYVNTIPIIGVDHLNKIIKRKKISDLIIALPNLGLFARRKLIKELSEFNLSIKIIPSIDSLILGKITINDFQSIELNDILDRNIELDLSSLRDELQNKVVLISGSGGSIGSELAKQIITNKPSKLVLIDHSEFNLYSILEDLEKIKSLNNINIELIPFLITIQDQKKLEKIFIEYNPKYIFHAAAYKHVPLIEFNIFAGIKNNILGTLNIVNLFKKYDCEKFILVSTDKAVRPKNIMGATKRVGELIVQAYAAEESKNKKYSIVRFGNVLNSSGSVIPLFNKQIKNGGPITLTHKDITRYFMTIPEAAGLILQCSILAKNGELFILDMGEPIKIIDIAKKMIKLSGLNEKNNEEGDIEIQITGLRPGEKLYEELLISKNFKKTRNKDILIAEEDFMKISELSNFLDILFKFNELEDIENIKELLSKNKHINYEYS